MRAVRTRVAHFSDKRLLRATGIDKPPLREIPHSETPEERNEQSSDSGHEYKKEKLRCSTSRNSRTTEDARRQARLLSNAYPLVSTLIGSKAHLIHFVVVLLSCGR